MSAPDSTNKEPTFGYPDDELLDLFRNGEVTLKAQIAGSSNATLLVDVKSTDGAKSHTGVYKPKRGEHPLHDFPLGLHRREVATYRLSLALGWEVVPPTTTIDGPLGEGSLQAFVDADFRHHYFSLLASETGTDDLRKICALDIVANNADRKSGHCLLAPNGRVYGIDHGLTFHTDFKLRTVIWDFVGEDLPDQIAGDLADTLADDVPASVATLLTADEVEAVKQRTGRLLEAGVFPPDDTGGRRWPWPIL